MFYASGMEERMEKGGGFFGVWCHDAPVRQTGVSLMPPVLTEKYNFGVHASTHDVTIPLKDG